MLSKIRSARLVAIMVLGALAPNFVVAEPLPYQNTQLSFETRAKDLVARMTLEEKVSQMLNNAPAIPHLGVPAYEWWNEALHGVARAGAATVFPQAIGLAASFDTQLLRDVANVISDEGRAKHHNFLRMGSHARYQGLTFWSPNVNIFRDPRWGRGQETYGEDPYLTSIMGVEFVKGLQQSDGTYRKLDATAKHFAVHSGPEADRHHFDVYPSERDLYETYLPAFRALVQDAGVVSVMGAYNRVNGESASASERLLNQILRKDWGFKGYVVSDCDSVEDIYKYHKIVATAEEASALAVKTGDDLNCGKTYKALTAAVKQGLITEAELDKSLTRLMQTRFELGMFDPVEKVSWAKIPYSVNQAPAHDQLAYKAAEKSLVLLKNNQLLPLSNQVKKIAVIGPTADEFISLVGNYYGTPAAPVTILQGIKNGAPAGTQVTYARGVDLVEGREEAQAVPLIESKYLRPNAQSTEEGLLGEYFKDQELTGKPVFTRIDTRIGFRWYRDSPADNMIAQGQLPANAYEKDRFSVRWTGLLLPPVTGRYEINVGANDGYRLFIDGKKVLDAWTTTERLQTQRIQMDLEAGKKYAIKLEYFDGVRDAEVNLSWHIPGAPVIANDPIEIAKAADVIVFVGGLTADIEGEEMKVAYPGFAGGDRTDIRLPQIQQAMLEKLHATGKPVVLVLTSGSALAIDWAQQHIPAILMSWYPGQRGGDAVADVLFGKTNPAGRLPITFYKANEKLPAFEDYSMKNRTYRYFTGEPLYPFGYGLSYTQFSYSSLTVSDKKVKADQTIAISVKVKNTGKVAGDEVVQLYVAPLNPKHERALKELRGVARVHIPVGETREVKFSVKPEKDFTIYDAEKKAYVVDAGKYQLQVGASSADIRLRQDVSVKGK